MDKILSINTIKNVFAALGAKTSDNNYGVALLDKTTAEPQGLMGMSDLASVLGASWLVPFNVLGYTDEQMVKVASNYDEAFLGFSWGSSTATNRPSKIDSGGVLLTLPGPVGSSSLRIQFVFDGTYIYSRRKNVSSDWSEWKEL